MNKEQIIEDMAQSDFCKELNRHCATCVHCSYYERAERNYNKGYRKQSDTAKEILQELDSVWKLVESGCMSDADVLCEVEDIITNKYSVEEQEKILKDFEFNNGKQEAIDLEEYDTQDCESCKYFNGDDNDCSACGKSFIVGIHREQNRKLICPLKKYRSRING